jgi:hypothetical protein
MTPTTGVPWEALIRLAAAVNVGYEKPGAVRGPKDPGKLVTIGLGMNRHIRPGLENRGAELAASQGSSAEKMSR